MTQQIGDASSAGRRERRAAEMRERIFHAAIELFAQRGLENVTVEQITERADVGKGTFFNYFPHKEAVLTYFGGSQVERLRHALERGEIRGDPREQVLQVMDVLASYPHLTPDLARNLFRSALSTPQFAETGSANIWHLQGVLEQIIREGQSACRFCVHRDAREAALFILGQYFLALLTWCTGFSSDSLPETVRRFVSLGLDGIAARD